MGHRKQLTSSVPPAPHHLIRMTRTRRHQAASLLPTFSQTHALPSSAHQPQAYSNHRPSHEHSRAAHYHSFRLPPRPPCRRAGRDETTSKQRRHMITSSRRPHSASSHPTAPITVRHMGRAIGQATGKHGTPHIDTGTDSKQARRDTRPDIQPPRSP